MQPNKNHLNLYRNKFNTTSQRLQHWNYGWPGAFFVTICTKNRACYFGHITNAKMACSEIGKIVENEWLKTTQLRPDMNIECGEFVIMPNHFHAIIVIGENEYNQCRDAMRCVSTNNNQNQFGPQSKNLASVIRGFKSVVTINARKINPEFGWQKGYYEHIIRDEKSYRTISEYIRYNSLKWQFDKLNQGNYNF